MQAKYRLFIVSLVLMVASLVSAQSWDQLGADMDGEAAEDLSGYSTSLSADEKRIAVGAPLNDGNGDLSGHVRIENHAKNIRISTLENFDEAVSKQLHLEAA